MRKVQWVILERKHWHFGLILVLALVAACSGPPSERITFNMSWLPQGSMSGVIVAIDIEQIATAVTRDQDLAAKFPAPFQQDDSRATLGGLNRGHQPRGSAADDEGPGGFCCHGVSSC